MSCYAEGIKKERIVAQTYVGFTLLNGSVGVRIRDSSGLAETTDNRAMQETEDRNNTERNGDGISKDKDEISMA